MIDYETRKQKIGKRIEGERGRIGLSKKELLARIYMSETSHKTVTAWEGGERLPDLTSLARMAELFECDIGYLLCDYDERTRDIADASKVTGLSAGAIENLIKYDKLILDLLSFLIESNSIVSVGFDASRCIDFLLEIEHYQKDVLSNLHTAETCDIWNLSQIDEKDLDILSKRTKVFSKITQLGDQHDAVLWRCEKEMNAAIEKYIDREVKRYGQHSRTP